MKKKGLFAVACACMMATGLCGGVLVAHADEDPDTEATTNYFASPGFDSLLDAETDERDVTEMQINGSIKAKKEADGNVYLEMGKSGNNAFWWSSMHLTEVGDYKVAFDVKHAEGWTGNSVFAGYRFWAGDQTPDFCNVTAEMNAATTDEWTHIETTYTVSAAMVSLVDSIQFGYDADADGVNFLMLDNVVIEYIVPEDGAPEVVGDAIANWSESEPEDITFEIDLKERDLLSVTNKDTEEEYDEGYVYDADAGTITFDSDFCYDLGEGKHTMHLTTEVGAIDLVINVYFAVPEIPSTTDGYRLDGTMKGGDFESYEVGLKFAEAQTDEAWGSLGSYDDVGTIVDDNGNHVLRLGRTEGSTKMYSSAFCMTSPDIQQGDIVTLKFAYKIVGDATAIGANSNVVFVGASNTDYHAIDYVQKNTTTREGNSNVQSWPVKYTDGENEYTEVEMSFIVDFSFMNATNSLRFLYQIGEGAEIYFDNVELIRWVDETAEDAEKPTVTPATATFNGGNKADVAVTVDLKDYLISSVKCGNDTVATTNYTLSSDDTTLTLKKEYLATLANGTHTFTITTLGGTCTFDVTVSGNSATPTTPDGTKAEEKDGLSGGAIAGIVIGCVAGVALIGLGVYFLIRRKKNKGKKAE